MMWDGAERRCFGLGLLPSLHARKGRVRAANKVKRCSSPEHSFSCAGQQRYVDKSAQSVLDREAQCLEQQPPDYTLSLCRECIRALELHFQNMSATSAVKLWLLKLVEACRGLHECTGSVAVSAAFQLLSAATPGGL